jgi:hypothetical protein
LIILILFHVILFIVILLIVIFDNCHLVPCHLAECHSDNVFSTRHSNDCNCVIVNLLSPKSCAVYHSADCHTRARHSTYLCHAADCPVMIVILITVTLMNVVAPKIQLCDKESSDLKSIFEFNVQIFWKKVFCWQLLCLQMTSFKK